LIKIQDKFTNLSWS